MQSGRFQYEDGQILQSFGEEWDYQDPTSRLIFQGDLPLNQIVPEIIETLQEVREDFSFDGGDQDFLDLPLPDKNQSPALNSPYEGGIFYMSNLDSEIKFNKDGLDYRSAKNDQNIWHVDQLVLKDDNMEGQAKSLRCPPNQQAAQLLLEEDVFRQMAQFAADLAPDFDKYYKMQGNQNQCFKEYFDAARKQCDQQSEERKSQIH
ncbi:hypothetical protein FGO68_gene16537 [Halteria grandinella]|uniref:Uncharacterized protein n=1 Tax=Halteria grandinella TaxID=5974 RepID=A0A8J8T7V1_HALGN|nr:hypothetical protein FGO68_gene16537 [Halteria grandinella]